MRGRIFMFFLGMGREFLETWVPLLCSVTAMAVVDYHVLDFFLPFLSIISNILIFFALY